jgi:hypothetical protein
MHRRLARVSIENLRLRLLMRWKTRCSEKAFFRNKKNSQRSEIMSTFRKFTLTRKSRTEDINRILTPVHVFDIDESQAWGPSIRVRLSKVASLI